MHRRAGQTAWNGERSSIALPLLQPHDHGRPKGGEPLQDRGAYLVRQALEVYPLAGLGANDGNALLPGPVLRVLARRSAG